MGFEGDVAIGITVLERGESRRAVEFLLGFEHLKVRPTHSDGISRKHQPRPRPVKHADRGRPWARCREGGDWGPVRGRWWCSVGLRCFGAVAGCGHHTAQGSDRADQVLPAGETHHTILLPHKEIRLLQFTLSGISPSHETEGATGTSVL